MKDRRIETISIGSAERSTRRKVNGNSFFKRRMCAFEKAWIMQERKTGSVCPELNYVEFSSHIMAFGEKSEHMSESALLARLRITMNIDGAGQHFAVRQSPQQLLVPTPIKDGGRSHLEILPADTRPVTVACAFQ